MIAYRRYVKYLLYFLSAFAVFFGIGYTIIYRAYEIAPYSEVVKVQSKYGAVYGSALNPNDLGYKIELLKLKKPELVVVGSSRMMQFRHQAFQRSFVNCGGVFRNLHEGSIFVDWMLKTHKPKIVLLGVDYWWFHPSYETEPDRHQLDETLVSAEKLTSPWKWLITRKLDIARFTGILVSGPLKNPFTRFENLGIHAIRASNGFRPDGSYLNTEDIYNISGTKGIGGMRRELEEIQRGENQRANQGVGSFADLRRLEQFKKILKNLKESGADVTIVLPPVSPLFLDQIKNKNPEFVVSLANELRAIHPAVFDFTDIRNLTKDNKEFLDGWHGGDVVYLRMLREITRRSPKSVLAKAIDLSEVGEAIEDFAGKKLVVFDDERGKYKKE